jgi:hypothetical protein
VLTSKPVKLRVTKPAFPLNFSSNTLAARQCGKCLPKRVFFQCFQAIGVTGAATTYFNDWYNRVIHTKLKPMKTVAKSIKERLRNVVSYCTHKITNAVAEGMNSKVMSIKRRVGGFRNRQNFKTAIFFYCDGLSLYPQ